MVLSPYKQEHAVTAKVCSYILTFFSGISIRVSAFRSIVEVLLSEQSHQIVVYRLVESYQDFANYKYRKF